MNLHNALLGTTFLRNAPDQTGGGGAPAAAPPAEAPAAAAPAPEPAASSASAAEQPAGGAPAPPAEPAPVAQPDGAVSAPEPPAGGAAAPDPEAKPEGGDIKAPEREPSLLEQAGKKPDAAASQAEPQPVPEAAPQPEPLKYEFKAPDGVEFDAARLGEYTTYLQEQKITPEVGQALLDRHAAEMQAYATSVHQHQMDAWRETNRQWQDASRADPEFGGSAFDTNMKKVAVVRDMFVPESERQAFNEFCAVTGAGNHPQFLKMLNRMAAWFNEPSSDVPAGGPTPNAGQAPRKGRGLQNFYKPTT